MHSWSVRKDFQRMLLVLLVLAYVTVSYIAANKCAAYEVNIIFKSRRSITSKGKIHFKCMDNSCNRRVYCLHRSFVTVHTKCCQWQASFTQEKSACLMEVSQSRFYLQNLGTRLALGKMQGQK